MIRKIFRKRVAVSSERIEKETLFLDSLPEQAQDTWRLKWGV